MIESVDASTLVDSKRNATIFRTLSFLVNPPIDTFSIISYVVQPINSRLDLGLDDKS